MLRQELSARLTVGAIIMVLLMPQFTRADDQLSATDKADLTNHLNTIADDPGWPQASVSAANNILIKSEYTAEAWNSFFSDYFSTNALTDRLHNYLVYPVFSWFDESVHLRLQEGLIHPLLNQNVENGWTTAIAGDGSTFASNPLLRQSVYYSQDMLTRMGKAETLSAVPARKQEIYDGLTNLISANPTVLKNNVTADRSSQPYFGTLRTQAHMALLANAPSASSSRPVFDPTVKTTICNTLGLTGDYAGLWNDHTVLFADNNLASACQRGTLSNFLNLIPSQLQNTNSITIHDYLGTDNSEDRLYFLERPYSGVNIFGIDVGVVSENSFPSDVQAGNVDLFSACLAHEVNHVVDHYAVQGDFVLAARRQALLAAAGNDARNYLRSMFDDGFFQQAPQEFIASIANEWFTDSSKTIELGLVRFDAGRHDPINQALFFAEIYSLGGDSTFFYNINTNGDILQQIVPLDRNTAGFIDELTFDGKQYRFDLDLEGNVLGYTIVPEPVALTLLASGGLGLVSWFGVKWKRRLGTKGDRRAY
jgi:hypothetical protein